MVLVEFAGDWHAYRQCPICQAPAGLPCFTRSGRVDGGRPDGAAVTNARPHIARKRSTRAQTPP